MLLPVIVLSLVFVTIQAFVVLFLAKRAIVLKLRDLWFLIASFAAYIVIALFGPLNAQLQILIQPLAPLLAIEFTRSTFYKRARSNHALVLSAAILFTAMTYVVKMIRLFAGDSELLFLSNQLMLFCVYFPGYAWLAKACFNASRRLSKEVGIEPWIKKRYLLLGTSSAFISLLITPSLFMGSTSTYYTILGFFCLLLIVVQLLVYSILNYLCWVMPPWFKRRLGTATAGTGAGLPGAGVRGEVPALENKVLTTRETVAIADYLGNMLAPLINRSPAATKGLLLITFQGEQDEKGIKPFSFSDVMHAIDHKLAVRLEQLGVKDAGAITREFSENVTRNQSVLLMMSV